MYLILKSLCQFNLSFLIYCNFSSSTLSSDDQDVTPQPSPIPTRRTSAGDGSTAASAAAAAAAAATAASSTASSDIDKSVDDSLDSTAVNFVDDEEEEEIEVEQETTVTLLDETSVVKEIFTSKTDANLGWIPNTSLLEVEMV